VCTVQTRAKEVDLYCSSIRYSLDDHERRIIRRNVDQA
jgi:hypothetical protein